jgi:hypothetical protein
MVWIRGHQRTAFSQKKKAQQRCEMRWKARKGSEVQPFDPVLSMLGDWWNETISHWFFREELVPVPLPLRVREGSLMKKITRLGKPDLVGKTDLRYGEATDNWYGLQCQQSKGIRNQERTQH